MTTLPLPRSRPSEQGVDGAGIVAFIDAIEAAPEVEPHSIMLLRHGHVIAESWWHPYSAERVHLLYSLSKSFTSTAVGFAVDEGLIDLDSTVLSYFPELDGEIDDPRSRSMLVRHIAAMASGHRSETIEAALAIDPNNLVRAFLLIPPDEEPGSIFAYNQPCTYTLSAIVQRVSGQSLTEFLRGRLFEPLGIGETGWIQDGSGREYGYSGLHATTDAIARLGQLYLQNGLWEGQQLISSDWVSQATVAQVDNPAESNPDWQRGYGFQFWMARHGYRGDGAYGQFCVVLPEHDVVLAMTGQTPDMQVVLTLAWEHLLPAFKEQSIDLAADSTVAQRLSELSVPTAVDLIGSAAIGSAPTGIEGRKFSAETGNDQPTLTTLTLTGSVADGWTITLHEGDSVITARVGEGEWVISDAVATSGGWIPSSRADEAELVVDVAFIETPHRLHLRCSWRTGTFTCRWMTEPLHQRGLHSLRSPSNSGGPNATSP